MTSLFKPLAAVGIAFTVGTTFVEMQSDSNALKLWLLGLLQGALLTGCAWSWLSSQQGKASPLPEPQPAKEAVAASPVETTPRTLLKNVSHVSAPALSLSDPRAPCPLSPCPVSRSSSSSSSHLCPWALRADDGVEAGDGGQLHDR